MLVLLDTSHHAMGTVSAEVDPNYPRALPALTVPSRARGTYLTSQAEMDYT